MQQGLHPHPGPASKKKTVAAAAATTPKPAETEEEAATTSTARRRIAEKTKPGGKLAPLEPEAKKHRKNDGCSPPWFKKRTQSGKERAKSTKFPNEISAKT